MTSSLKAEQLVASLIQVLKDARPSTMTDHDADRWIADHVESFTQGVMGNFYPWFVDDDARLAKAFSEIERAAQVVHQLHVRGDFREYISDTDLFSGASAQFLAEIPEAQRTRSADVAARCLAYAKRQVNVLKVYLKKGKSVGATGARRLRQTPEVIEANQNILQAEAEVHWGTMFAYNICGAMYDRFRLETFAD